MIDIEKLSINTIRTLSMDAVQAADSGHPGTPMALAPLIYCLWQRILRFDPNDPAWPDRDRFVLSAGHASMLLYSILYLAGVRDVNNKSGGTAALAVDINNIKRFRQLGSKCPGHPEYRLTPGVETTTGPLGQGAAVSVGMAIAGRWMAAYFNRPGFELFNYNVYAVCGDGCIMEGVTSEAASIAGHLGLSNLCWIYDNNGITIEGDTALSFSDNVEERFSACRWKVMRVKDVNDIDALEEKFRQFRQEGEKPVLIIVDSHIAYGAPNKQDTSAAHGQPLGEEEIRLAKKNYGWPQGKKFFVPEGVINHFASGIGKRGERERNVWMNRFEEYRRAYPGKGDELCRMQRGDLPDGWDKGLPVFPADPNGMPGRRASGIILNAIAAKVPWILGGSADLSPSTKTRLDFPGAGDFSSSGCGRNIHFGIREHAMGAVLNGMAHCGIRPFGSSFLVFSDYMKEPIRLSALMENPVIYVFTHDSIGIGEDGPTHQPIEQIASLRAVPGLIVLRPADANEFVEAWRIIMRLRRTPAVLIASRQAVTTIDRGVYNPACGARRGAYILAGTEKDDPDVILISTGSEVSLCIKAYERLKAEGINARVVSMPSWELFERQDKEYRDYVLPPHIKARVAVEAASGLGWERYAGEEGAVICMRTFGASAPAVELQKKFGFTPDRIAAAAKEQIRG